MIYKFTSIKAVVAKILMDLGMEYDEVPFQNFVEWIIEGLKYIGVSYQYVTKDAVIEISGYQAPLPCDFVHLIKMLKVNEQLPKYNSFLTTDSTRNEENKYTHHDWKIENNRILTSFSSGTVEFQYQAVPVDEEGLPLVPDSVEYHTALFWRVVYQLNIYGKTFKNKYLNDLAYVQQQWRDYCNQAGASGLMPDLETLNRIKNNWVRLYDQKNPFETRFAKSGEKEYRRHRQ